MDDTFDVGLAIEEVGVVVDMADLFLATRALLEVGEVVALEAVPELASPDEDRRVRVVVSQLVIATWHCCEEVALGKV